MRQLNNRINLLSFMNALDFCLLSLKCNTPGQILKSVSRRSPIYRILIEVNESMTQGKTSNLGIVVYAL